MLEVVKFVRANRFDRIYDLQGNDRSGLICALSKANERVGNHTRYPYTHHPIDEWKRNTHIFERLKRVLASAHVEVSTEIPVLPCTTNDLQHVETWLEKHIVGSSALVGIHAGASANRPEKCWPHFAKFANKLLNHGFTPVWLGASSDTAQNQIYIQASGGVDASGAFTIPQLAYLGQHFEFAVTNDSGPMHVLAAAGKPIYGLFGPSDWRRNHALGQARYVITNSGQSTSLSTISAEYVWQRLISEHQI